MGRLRYPEHRRHYFTQRRGGPPRHAAGVEYSLSVPPARHPVARGRGKLHLVSQRRAHRKKFGLHHARTDTRTVPDLAAREGEYRRGISASGDEICDVSQRLDYHGAHHILIQMNIDKRPAAMSAPAQIRSRLIQALRKIARPTFS